ncbi:uncharacterized protein [Onthophagus taurus]|uniref:uncharacterized protein n=1 Tax=Onthophagus taurus TaxID=166361 RepID=UPI000C2067C0|nr:uncharacterized protein LOC111421083 [Onthophagus taurus]
MEYFKGLYRRFANTEVVKKEDVEMTRMNAYLNAVHKIVFWEDPGLSWAVLSAVHVLFWAIVYFQFKLYGILFFTILILFIADNYFERIGLLATSTPSADTIQKIIICFKKCIGYFHYFRAHNPPTFAFIMCSFFGILTYISKKVPGYFLAYVNILAVFFLPLIISKLPEKYKKGISCAMVRITTNEGVVAEHELIPYISEKDLNDKDEIESVLTDKTVDSITSSFISGISTMPSHMEGEGSVDGLEEDDLLPTQQPKPRGSFTAVDNYSSDSDSDSKGLQFESGHFKDSSSDEEINYTVGLQFTDDPLGGTQTIARNLASGLLSNLTSMGQALVTNVLTQQLQGTQEERPRRHDSDSDFEFINSDEVDMN